MHELRMPSLGADMDHAKVVEWLVKPGDAVRRGDLIASVDTDKTVMDVESFEDGVVAEYLVGVGETVDVGTPILRLDGGGESAPAGPEPEAHEPEVPAPGAPAAGAQPAVQAPGESAAREPGAPSLQEPGRGEPGRHAPAERAAGSAAQRVRSSPLARRLAAGLGIDLAAVRGTGQQGSISESDVRRAAGEAAHGTAGAAAAGAGLPPAEAPRAGRAETPGTAEAPGRAATLRAALGSLMAKSKATVPHYYLSTTLDLAPALALMQERNLGRPVSERLVPAAFLFKAAALAARDVPGMNGFWKDAGYEPSDRVHLGVAVALRGGGLVAPALHDADTLALDELMAKLRDLVARARAGRLLRTEMADATVTVTSLGDLGVEAVFGVIVPPQVAMLGFGRVVERPWAENGMLGVRPTVTATLSADHRVSDGLGGGRCLARIQELLLAPDRL
ncbi:dihydrolipoamide acetyltransferase family protein [Sinomonas halotolerans]|uniref:Dihydrolipoamide acetyltransferase component of pyruvate dehydrogenase complex n=1 Tax=Sinomonas halotolerans TaxID=1644133 RepID=A0ABU9WZK3_9MICC